MPSPKSSKIPCHISDKIKPGNNADDIRKSVCRDLKTSGHTDGKHYCLLHFPAKEKDAKEFETIRKARFAEVEAAVAELEELPEEERKVKLSKIRYDFRYVYFPSKVNLSDYKYLANADFSSAAFSGDAYFRSAVFSGNSDFSEAAFSRYADFREAVFSGYADFRSAAFSIFASFSEAAFLGYASFRSADFSGADFTSAAFSGDAGFSSAAFSGNASFSEATFSGDASFNSATFQKRGNFEDSIFFSIAGFYKTEFVETSEIFFKKTKFCGNVKFEQAMFEGFVSFEGNSDEKVFPGRNDVSKVMAELKERFSGLKQTLSKRKIEFRVPDAFINKAEYDLRNTEENTQDKATESYEELQARIGNQEAILDLQNARLKKPERITFHTARLRPNWFVNTDSRQMVFTDCRWDNIDQTGVKDRLGGKNKKQLNANINAELQALTKRGVREEKRMLEIACRQLSVNAEENNRYEDASKFRYMAMETKRLEYRWHGRFYTLSWWYRLSSGYGESWGRAALILLFIWFAFAWAYTGFSFFITPLPPAPIGFARWEKKALSAKEFANPAQSEDTEGERFVFGKALWYSGAVMALQRPEPKPATNWTRGLIIFETILGPLQAALLALAIRRKFMR